MVKQDIEKTTEIVDLWKRIVSEIVEEEDGAIDWVYKTF